MKVLTPIQGKRVLLRDLNPADDAVLGRILNDRETMESLVSFFGIERWTKRKIEERFSAFRRQRAEGTRIPWVVEFESRIVGNCSLKGIDPDRREAEFGIILHRSVWGLGVARECFGLALGYAYLALGLDRIYFKTEEHNVRMRGFFSKHGIPQVRTTPEGRPFFELSKELWRSKIAAKLNG